MNFYIPDCPPRPEAIIYGVAVGLVDKKTAPVQFKPFELTIPRYHPSDLRGDANLVVYEKVEKSRSNAEAFPAVGRHLRSSDG